MKYGHLKLSRKLFDGADPLWQEPRVFSRFEAWVDLIQMAAWKATVYSTTHGDDALERGELVASLRYLATRWGWGKNVVARFFEYLEKAGRIAGQRTGHHGRVYLIVNYSEYQRTPNERGTEDGTGSGTVAGQGRDTPGTEAGQRRRQLSSETAAATPARGIAFDAVAGEIGAELTAELERVVTVQASDVTARSHLSEAQAWLAGMYGPPLPAAQVRAGVADYVAKIAEGAREPNLAYFRGFIRRPLAAVPEPAPRAEPPPTTPRANGNGSHTGRLRANAIAAAPETKLE